MCRVWFLVPLGIGGCGGSTEPPPPAPPVVATVIIEAPDSDLVIGANLQVAASAEDSAGRSVSGAVLVWASSDTAVLSVSVTGLVHALKPGSAEVRVTAGGHVASVTFRVRQLAFVSVSGGESHTCALTADGEAFCWGKNIEGQLGTADTLGSWWPRRVRTTLRFAQISAGFDHTCAISTTGAAYCWGANLNQALGSGGSEDELVLTPRLVSGGISWMQVSADQWRTCGIATGGAAYCWGGGFDGDLGNGDPRSFSPVPALVIGDHLYSSIGLGDSHTCASGTDHVTYCWGLWDDVRLGSSPQPENDCTSPCSLAPHPINGTYDLTGITVGQADTCGLEAVSGAVYCWGVSQPAGTGSPVVERSEGLVFVAISAGAYHVCGIVVDGAAYCWGLDGGGQLGDGQSGEGLTQAHPIAVVGGRHWLAIAAGVGHTCGIATDHLLYCWGNNADGQVGVSAAGIGGGFVIPIPVPTPVTGQQ